MDGGVISEIEFVSLGGHTGVCGSYSTIGGVEPQALAAVEAMCVGKRSCEVSATADALGLRVNPSNSQPRRLVVQARCR